MDLHGFEKIKSVFAAAGIDADVTPKPKKKHVRFVMLQAADMVDALNALDACDFMESDHTRDVSLAQDPLLTIAEGLGPDTILLEDKNIPRLPIA